MPDIAAYLRQRHDGYGRVDRAARSIFEGYLGWFDVNPVNLNKLTPKVEAEKMVIFNGRLNFAITYLL